VVWSRDGDRVIETWSRSERDCDGLYTDQGCRWCDDLESHSFKDDDDEVVTVPRWEEHSRLVRDHTAEAAGY
jgi:hypothetical protein